MVATYNFRQQKKEKKRKENLQLDVVTNCPSIRRELYRPTNYPNHINIIAKTALINAER